MTQMTRPKATPPFLLLTLLSALSACALLQRGPIKSDPRGASPEAASAAAAMRKAREKALAQPASAEAAREYVAAVTGGIQAGLRREAETWEWDKIVDEASGGVDRNCGSGPPDVCAPATMEQARLLWATKRPGEAVKTARRSLEIKPTLETAGLLIKMYDERNNHEPVVDVCEAVKDLIRAEPQEKKMAWLRLCLEQSRTGSMEKALAWLTPDELKEANTVISGAQETDRYARMIRRAKDDSDKVRKRAFNLDRQWNVYIHARCPQRMYLCGELNPWADGARIQPLDKGDAKLPVSMGAVIWVFDENKKPIRAAVVDERSFRLDVECRDFQLH